QPQTRLSTDTEARTSPTTTAVRRAGGPASICALIARYRSSLPPPARSSAAMTEPEIKKDTHRGERVGVMPPGVECPRAARLLNVLRAHDPTRERRGYTGRGWRWARAWAESVELGRRIVGSGGEVRDRASGCCARDRRCALMHACFIRSRTARVAVVRHVRGISVCPAVTAYGRGCKGGRRLQGLTLYPACVAAATKRLIPHPPFHIFHSRTCASMGCSSSVLLPVRAGRSRDDERTRDGRVCGLVAEVRAACEHRIRW
ncbi:hypothetical protein DFH09DRAFT_1210737, partial [Mycena vulgaris]